MDGIEKALSVNRVHPVKKAFLRSLCNWPAALGRIIRSMQIHDHRHLRLVTAYSSGNCADGLVAFLTATLFADAGLSQSAQEHGQGFIAAIA